MVRTPHCNAIQSRDIVGVLINGGKRLRIQKQRGRRSVVSNFMYVHACDIEHSLTKKSPLEQLKGWNNVSHNILSRCLKLSLLYFPDFILWVFILHLTVINTDNLVPSLLKRGKENKSTRKNDKNKLLRRIFFSLVGGNKMLTALAKHSLLLAEDNLREESESCTKKT